MRLVFAHYHWRPGGVRRVVESSARAWAGDTQMAIDEVVFAGGEPPPPAWENAMRALLAESKTRVSFISEAAFGYAAGWQGSPRELPGAALQAARRVALTPETLVVLENPALGRNVGVAQAWVGACHTAGARLLCRHHDFFFDARWERWPEIAAGGFAAWEDVLAAVFPTGPGVAHVSVSARDAAWLHAAGLAESARESHWPNLAEVPDITPEETEAARAWLHRVLGRAAPVWLLPCRLLRRKNIIEAAVLARLLRPDAVLVTTGGPSSAAETAYAEALATMQRKSGGCWHLGALADVATDAPRVPALMRASERVLATSLFEGFGLPCREAAALGVPWLARREALVDGGAAEGPPGATGAAIYDELRIDRAWIDWPAEKARQQAAFARHRALMPPAVAALLPEPPWWRNDAPVALSRLTLAGQSAVLERLHRWSPHEARALFHPLNPWLQQATASAATPHPLPRETTAAHTARLADFWENREVTRADPPPAPSFPAALMAERLAAFNHYPLLWPGGDGVAS